MPEMILPGTYIEVRPEGLIAPGQITVGNIGVVGTAARGPVGVPVLLGSMQDALETFYPYDSWFDDPVTHHRRANELTLTRALELAFNFGGNTVFAVRVADQSSASKAAKASYDVPATGPGNIGATLTAKTEGTWGNDLGINVSPAAQDAFIDDEQHLGTEVLPITLKYTPKQSARNRVTQFVSAAGKTLSLPIVYAPTAASPGEVQIDPATRHITFNPAPANADVIDVSYVVDAAHAELVTLQLGHAQETYTVVDSDNLVAQLASSAWVDATAGPHHADLPDLTTPAGPPLVYAKFKNGVNGIAASDSDYQAGLDALLNQEAHIIVAAGRDDRFGNKLDAHCQKASTDAIKHDRVGVTGSQPMNQANIATSFDQIIGHNLDSDRLIYVAPGIHVTDTPTGGAVTLPGAYAAAAFAGLLSSLSAHVSPTNKVLPVDELEAHFDSAHLTQLVTHRVLALERRQGFHVVKGITTSTGSAFSKITTRRIVDYAKFGVRSAADPYIGLLNNERVRGSLRATINSFLAGMVDDEMLQTYDVSVTATRPQEIQGIVAVALVLRPVFSIDYIKVTMFLQ